LSYSTLNFLGWTSPPSHFGRLSASLLPRERGARRVWVEGNGMVSRGDEEHYTGKRSPRCARYGRVKKKTRDTRSREGRCRHGCLPPAFAGGESCRQAAKPPRRMSGGLFALLFGPPPKSSEPPAWRRHVTTER